MDIMKVIESRKAIIKNFNENGISYYDSARFFEVPPKTIKDIPIANPHTR